MKPVVIDPKTTTRAAAFDLWMNAPNPMVSFFITLDVTPLVQLSRRRGLKFNKGLFRTTLKLSFQFHHTQMDGAHAGRFLERLQKNIAGIKAL